MVTRSNLKIEKRIIGDNYKPFIIAEVGQAHEGKINKVYKYIDSISKTGVDAIKFQTHLAEEESTLDEPFRKNSNFNFKFKNRYEYWKSVEFNIDEWIKIKRYVEKKNLIFLSSVFSIKAARMMKKIGIKAIKIGSGEFNSIDLINEIVKIKLPLLLSTGMVKLNEIEKLNKILVKKKAQFGFFQCTSAYPVKLEKVGINIISELKKKFNCPIGLSDHSGTIYPSIFGISLNTNMLELHVKLDNDETGPDVTSSVNLKELKQVCEINDAVYLMRKNPINKKILGKDIKKMREIFGKSISLNKDFERGETIKKENILMKKPGTGFAYKDINKIIGKKTLRFVSKKRILKKSDIE
ncbi:N-acetylneuraminate synthase family protein [Candidatus Pelagibacter ubique]|jgi:N,N'-diacetyllegionaminate synthase|nr:N-acetylneuraminate synthase family protein [Candidatus Pelagibacter ubique]